MIRLVVLYMTINYDMQSIDCHHLLGLKYVCHHLLLWQAPHLSTLRLLCLLSLTQDGLTPREYKSLKTDFLHVRGLFVDARMQMRGYPYLYKDRLVLK